MIQLNFNLHSGTSASASASALFSDSQVESALSSTVQSNQCDLSSGESTIELHVDAAHVDGVVLLHFTSLHLRTICHSF